MSGRLVIATHYWAPHVGGVETVAREQARRLTEMGWQVEVFTTRLGADAARAMDGEVRLHRYRCVNWQERRLSVPVPLPSPRMLRDLLRHVADADMVLVHGHCYPASVYGAYAARATGKPLVVVQSNPFVDYPFPLAAIEHGVNRSIGRWVLHQARLVICVSRYVQRYVRRIAPRARTEVVYSGVDVERFRPRGHGSPGLGLRILTLRRLVPRNGVDVLVEAWRRAALGGAAGLTVAGSGPQEAKLRRMASGMASVRFLGRVAEEDVAGLYRAADVFVVPSVSGEGFGIVAAEALASGVPVIATSGGATGELVRHDSDGVIVPAGDPGALAAALARLVADGALLARMAAAARARRPQLSWDVAMHRFASALEVVNGH